MMALSPISLYHYTPHGAISANLNHMKINTTHKALACLNLMAEYTLRSSEAHVLRCRPATDCASSFYRIFRSKRVISIALNPSYDTQPASASAEQEGLIASAGSWESSPLKKDRSRLLL